VDYAARAGERAARLLAYEEAADHYAQALAALDVLEAQRDGADVPAVARDEQRCSLLIGLAEAKNGAGQPDEARAEFRRAHAVARSLLGRCDRQTAASLLARAALGIAGQRPTAVRVDTAVLGLLEESRRAFDGWDHPLHACVLTRLATELFVDRDTARTRRRTLSAEAVAMARRLNDVPALAVALRGRHLSLWEPENLSERLTIADESLAVAETSGDKVSIAWGHMHRLADRLELGDVMAVNSEIAELDRLAEELRVPLFRSAVLIYRAMQALLGGQFEDGVTLAQQACGIGQHAGGDNSMLYLGQQLFLLRREQGRLAELEDAITTFVQRFPQFPGWRVGLATLYGDLGRESEARREFECFAQAGFANVPRDMSWTIVVGLLAELCARFGDARRAQALYEILVPYAGRAVVTGNAVACLGAINRYLALLAATMGRDADAASYFEDALAMNERMGAVTFLAHTQYEYANMLAARGREPERAAALLARAHETAETLGMTPLLNAARALKDLPVVSTSRLAG
jgi:tetratricopeptide (TPR) repeat protein